MIEYLILVTIAILLVWAGYSVGCESEHRWHMERLAKLFNGEVK